MAVFRSAIRLPRALGPAFLLRFVLRYGLLLAILIFLVTIYVFPQSNPFAWGISLPHFIVSPTRPIPTTRIPLRPPIQPLAARVPCYGPRGKLLSESPEDELRAVKLKTPYPIPFAGSHDDLGLDKTWLTAEGRYGPYGLGEDAPDYGRSKVDWEGSVDWGALQNACYERNAQRFPGTAARPFVNYPPRFAARRDDTPPMKSWDEFADSRRTALVIRAYDGYKYTPEDTQHLRALITEASLRTGGEYTVIFLVHIRSSWSRITKSQAAYDAAFEAAGIPKEFQSIAILWDMSLLKSWYPLVGEHRVEWQVFQPVQLLAYYYPEFDHFWQIELDVRFTGDAGKYLNALSEFARKEPRKQMLERSTFFHVQRNSGTYANFSLQVDRANGGKSILWGPLRVPEVSPIGPEPPTPRPEEDAFTWGVGEDADVLVSSFCADVAASKTWWWRNWIRGFSLGRKTPRYTCPPAVMRGSRNLLLAVHAAQAIQGLRLPSEATLPSFAVWHGLKLSYPPAPLFLKDEEAVWRDWDRDGPAESATGVGSVDLSLRGGSTWWWISSWPGHIMDVWLNNELDASDFPYFFVKKDGKVWMPNFAMHPVKTQGHR